MLRLNRYIVALVVWLAFLFNIERLEVSLSEPRVVNIAPSVYIVATLMVLLGLTLPHWRRVRLWRLWIIAAAAFVVASLTSHRPVWGGAYTYVSLFHFCAIMLSATLGYMVGRLSAEFVESVRALTFSDMDDRVFAADQAEPMIKREMQYSRRANRPLSVMVINTTDVASKLDLTATMREIQQLLARQHNLIALTRLLTRTLRRTDFVLDQTKEGRLVLVMPEVRKEQAQTIVNRISDSAQRKLGVNMHYGIASFPDSGVTFDELVRQAELDIEPQHQERRVEASEAHSATEKLAVMEVAE